MAFLQPNTPVHNRLCNIRQLHCPELLKPIPRAVQRCLPRTTTCPVVQIPCFFVSRLKPMCKHSLVMCLCHTDHKLHIYCINRMYHVVKDYPIVSTFVVVLESTYTSSTRRYKTFSILRRRIHW
ncbi:LOW QUALITY PROTEIN: uncharacterized protein LOC110229019 [Arabidopsis lyrata subsp. lyrata]|uniref:LOW QUALITY PROTEIN: uncharacterized protein LOC110229019 n=1 Tax=Arabidopsis lyrata subsp. lyrata TaxID=81972 RepID=UPI000A29C275|nr:LOW QUALITY PROTEIN: uncharacterized protein LOC110229019 [Arabidopsis lyrata subsp. lyrata]|eukprot:XP_020883382.1 LOW QUALITY PROTEIN: uncharacterized protein LOC110229019 [Arabidopsis lyrata subsp. lyrata]